MNANVKIILEKHRDTYVAYPIGLEEGVIGQGATNGEALVEVLRARALWLEAARAEGKPVPPPLFRPAIYKVA